MRALVTGANGFVGRHLLAHLAQYGDSATGVDRDCDVTDSSSVLEVLERTRPEVIYHLAAQIDVRASVADPGNDALPRAVHVGQRQVRAGAHHVLPRAVTRTRWRHGLVVCDQTTESAEYSRPRCVRLHRSFSATRSEPEITFG